MVEAEKKPEDGGSSGFFGGGVLLGLLHQG